MSYKKLKSLARGGYPKSLNASYRTNPLSYASMHEISSSSSFCPLVSLAMVTTEENTINDYIAQGLNY